MMRIPGHLSRWSAVLCAVIAANVAALDNGLGLTPPMGWSSWNFWGARVNETVLMNSANLMVTLGMKDAGYTYLNLDDGWSVSRNSSHYLVEDKVKFPRGLKFVVDYVHSKGLKFGIYTARGSKTCLGRPGSDSYESEDANLWANWGVDYLKEDSCGGTTHGTVWEQYSRMRDALNATGRPIYYSITQSVPFEDAHPAMHCYGNSVFTTLPWVKAGLDPTTLANSYLVEYCNNYNSFGFTGGVPKPGGFLSNLDSQQLLALDNLTQVGAYSDNDMLQICNGGMTFNEDRAQFATWAILSSPLIMGNDLSTMDDDCKKIALNSEVIAISQDSLVSRGKLVFQWPDAHWPNTTLGGVDAAGAVAPTIVQSATIQPCVVGAANQQFSYDRATGLVKSVSTSLCLTYSGYHESSFGLAACTGWTDPGIGGQIWNVSEEGVFYQVGNGDKCIDVFDCAFNTTKNAPAPLQVCSCRGLVGQPDCFAKSPGCGGKNLKWIFNTAAVSSSMQSVLDPTYCATAVPLPISGVNITVQVWRKPLKDGSMAVVVFNRGTTAATVDVQWAWLGLPANKRFRVRDLHAHADQGSFATVFPAEVGPHDSRALRFYPSALPGLA